MKEIFEIQLELVSITDKLRRDGAGGKSLEPSISVTLNNEFKWSAEIYSYLIDLNEGGRHHSFSSDTYEDLIKSIWESINKYKNGLDK